MAQVGKPVVVPLRPPLTAEAMEATVAFQEEAAAHGVATFPSVSRAARTIRRLLDWQAGRE